MEHKTITAVGIDVSKGKSTVAVRRPGGEVVLTPFQVEHDAAGLSGLVRTLQNLDGDIRIVMEHTGMYWRPIALALKEAGFFVSVVNAILIHDFSDNSLRKVKTDKADSMKIANYALSFWAELRAYSPEDETRQMLKMQNRLYLRTKKSSVVLRNGLISLLPDLPRCQHAFWQPAQAFQRAFQVGGFCKTVLAQGLCGRRFPCRFLGCLPQVVCQIQLSLLSV